MGAICVTMLPIAVLKLILLHFYWQPHLLKKNLGFENSEILKCVPESVHIFHWILRHVRKYIWIFSNPEFVLYCSWRLKTLTVTHLGKLSPSKTDEFSEKFQTAFDPPPLIFGKLCCTFFPKFMTEVSSIMAKICNINFWIENDPPPLFGTFPKIHPFWKG